MTIFCDIDDTLTDEENGFSGTLLKHLNDTYNTTYAINDVISWNWYKDTFGGNCFASLEKDSFWHEVEVNPQAIEVLLKRAEKGDKIYIATASMFLPSLSTKINSVISAFNSPFITDKNIIVCYDKWLLSGNYRRVIIDDKPQNVEGFNGWDNGWGILMDKPWNHDYQLNHYSNWRANGWGRVEERLEFIDRFILRDRM